MTFFLIRAFFLRVSFRAPIRTAFRAPSLRAPARLCALLVALLLAACANTSDVNVRYAGAEPPGKRLLLAARTPEEQTRSQWETACAPLLEKAGYSVTRSAQVLPEWYEPGNSALEARAAALDLDVILVAELTGLLLTPFRAVRETRLNPDAGVHNPVHEDIGSLTNLREYREVRDTPPANQNIEVTLLTRDGQPLWRGDIETREANSVRAIAHSQCQALIRAL